MAFFAEKLRHTTHYVPTVLVFCALSFLAYYGHHTGWRIPRFSELAGQKQEAEQEDWCAIHNVPDSRCIACHPELVGADPADWCKEHGLPESQCTLCHPDLLTGGTADWCPEHGIPEKSCTLCHPEIAVKSPPLPSDIGAKVSYASSAKPVKDPKTCQTHQLRVQFSSLEAVHKAGVKVASVQERPMAASIAASGQVEYDQTRLARLNSRAPGSAWRIEAVVGQSVRSGDLLALIDAAEAGKAKAELLQALTLIETKTKMLPSLQAAAQESKHLVEVKSAYFKLVERVAKEALTTKTELQQAEAELADARLQALKMEVELEEAEAALSEARIRLFNAQQALTNLGLSIREKDLLGLLGDKLTQKVRLLGLPDSSVKNFETSVATANLLPVLAPFDGVVVSRDVVVGEAVDASKPLIAIADVSRMWIMLDVREEDAAKLALGQKAVFRPDGGSNDVASGTLSWISTAVDEKTRTVKVRAEVENTAGWLRAHTFGAGRITIRETPKAAAIPHEAIHWEGCCYIVFVRLTDDIFQVRKVKVGSKNGPFTEILIGLLPGEVVATAGSHVLKSEILKSMLGAGCCAE